MPYNVTLGVGPQIEATNHHSTLFEILAYGKGKQVLVDLTLVVQLLNEERCTLPSRDGCQPQNTITGHAR